MTSAILRIIGLFALGTLSSTAADAPPAYTPEVGDFVFQSLAHGELVDAIEGATDSAYSHVGLVVKKGGDWYVREAVGPVRDTPLKNWIAHGRMNGAFDAYRLKAAHRRHIPELVNRSATFLGRPYDIRYEMDDEKIYCSELLYKSMLAASGEKVGRLQKLGDLNWRPYRATIEKIEGGPVPVSREMITPRALAEGEQLEPVFRGYPASDAAKKTRIENPAPPSRP